MSEAQNRQQAEMDRRQQIDVESEQLAQLAAELAQVRESKRVTIDQMASRLKVSPAKLSSIEKGDMTSLGSLVFVKAILRSYGKTLEYDLSGWQNVLSSNTTENRVGQAYVSSYRMEHSKTLPPRQVFESQSVGRWLWAGLLFVTLIGLYIAVERYNESIEMERSRFNQNARLNLTEPSNKLPSTASTGATQLDAVSSTSASATLSGQFASAPVVTEAGNTNASGVVTNASGVVEVAPASAAVGVPPLQANANESSQQAPMVTPAGALTASPAVNAPVVDMASAAQVTASSVTMANPVANVDNKQTSPVASSVQNVGVNVPSQNNASAVAANTMPVIEFTLTDQSWVEAKERDGSKRKMTGSNYQGGQKITINHDRPYRLKVGRADVLTGFMVNGQPYDYSKFVKGNVLTLDVPLPEAVVAPAQ